jgi:hypothetical protein
MDRWCFLKQEVQYPKKLNMLAIILPVNIYLFGGLLLFSFLAGFFLQRGRIKSSRKKVIELENEMLSNHADILDLQKEKSALEQRLKELHIPVISITASKEENNPAKMQDLSARKMSQQPGKAKHS